MKGYDRLNPAQSIKSSLLVFTLCIRCSSSLASLYLKSSPLFGSTSTRGVLGGLPTPRHTLRSLLPDGVPPERRDLGLLRRRPSAPSRTIRAPGVDRTDVHRRGVAPAPGRGPSAPPQRAPPDGPSSVWRPGRRQHIVSPFKRISCSYPDEAIAL
jgi:hypothetical protein